MLMSFGGVVLAAIVVGATWLLTVLLQIVDVGTGHFVRRAGRTAGTRDRDRILTWMIAVGSVVLIAVIVGVDFSLRIVFGLIATLPEAISLLIGLVSLVICFAIAVVAALLASRALRRPETGYQVIRDELRGQSGARLSKGRIADYRSWLRALDERSKDLRRKIVIGRVVRSVPVIISICGLILVVVAYLDGEVEWWLIAISALAVALTIWLAIRGAQISLARNLAIHAVHQKQRAESLLLLSELERKAPKKVAGLSERVSRALAILREQQSQPTQENRPR